MRICLIAKNLDLRSGGVARVPLELKRGLEKRGHKVDIITSNIKGSVGYLAHITAGIPLHLMGKKYDIVHAITPMESLWVSKEKGVVTFLDFMMLNNWQDIDAGLDKNWKKGFGVGLFSFMASWASKFNKIVCISEETKQDLIRLYKVKEDKVKVIRLGINEDLGPQPKLRDGLTIGYLGQVDKRKRVDYLITAFLSTSLDATLLIGGEGSLRKQFVNRSPRIYLPGFIPENMLCIFYNSLDVFIFPSKVEGYGLPIVEAMACKKPVVVLEDAIIPKDLKERCILVPSLRGFFKDKERITNLKGEIDIEGNYKFAKEHSWEKCAQEYEEVYREMKDGR